MSVIYIVFKAYRQKDGEYFAVETEMAFNSKGEAEAYMKEKPASWWETRPVPVSGGQVMQVEFLGMRAVHETELK